MSKTISLELAPDVAKVPNRGGRPRKEIDRITFEKLCEIQCTLTEIAGVLRVSEDTVERWCERTYELGFAECFKKFSAAGKTSLRRQQFELAKKGNATMLIWLGKQYLGQTDKPIEAVDEEINLDELSNALCGALVQAAVRRRASQRTIDKEDDCRDSFLPVRGEIKTASVGKSLKTSQEVIRPISNL